MKLFHEIWILHCNPTSSIIQHTDWIIRLIQIIWEIHMNNTEKNWWCCRRVLSSHSSLSHSKLTRIHQFLWSWFNFALWTGRMKWLKKWKNITTFPLIIDKMSAVVVFIDGQVVHVCKHMSKTLNWRSLVSMQFAKNLFLKQKRVYISTV